MKELSRRADKPVYYFGLWEPLLGEVESADRHPQLFDKNGKRMPGSFFVYLPWDRYDLGGGLLHAMNVHDAPTGKLYWRHAHHWHVFTWWDRSAKDEPGTASSFLAYQFPFLWRTRALSQCLRTFATIAQRQQPGLRLSSLIPHRGGKLDEGWGTPYLGGGASS